MDQATASPNTFNPESAEVRKYLQDLHTPWKMYLHFFMTLPSLILWRVRVKSVEPARAQVTIPFGWRTQNPFRSIYFAAQCGAAELSTGLLAMLAIKGRGRISMLITKVEADFVKKANSLTTFSCEDGDKILEAVQKAIDTGEGQTVTVVSTGTQATGEVVSRIRFTWSFKVKS